MRIKPLFVQAIIFRIFEKKSHYFLLNVFLEIPMSEQTNEPIIYQKRGKIAFITINTKMNTLNLENTKKFLDVLNQAEEDPKVSVIVLKTSGDKVFSAGWDLSMFQTDFKSIQEEFFKYCGSVSKTMFLMKKPIIAQVQGSAIGTGVTLQCSSDFRIVANKKDIFWRLPEVDLPLFPTTGPTISTYSVIGPIHTKDMLMTGRDVLLEELDKWGAFTKVVEPEELEKETLRLAKQLARKPTNLIQTIKPMMNILTMNPAEKFYQIEDEMGEYFFADYINQEDPGDIDEFIAKKREKFGK